MIPFGLSQSLFPCRYLEIIKAIWSLSKTSRCVPYSILDFGLSIAMLLTSLSNRWSLTIIIFVFVSVAGILGYAVGKASYVGTCRRKFQELGLGDGPGYGPWSKGGRLGPISNSGPGHRWGKLWIYRFHYHVIMSEVYLLEMRCCVTVIAVLMCTDSVKSRVNNNKKNDFNKSFYITWQR